MRMNFARETAVILLSCCVLAAACVDSSAPPPSDTSAALAGSGGALSSGGQVATSGGASGGPGAAGGASGSAGSASCSAMCEGQCVDTASDPLNCGGCGIPCAAGLVCSLGQCQKGCAPGLTACGGACVDITGSAAHCGSCTNACPAGQDCWQSACRCPTGQASCDGGACQDVFSDTQNCGTCHNVCAVGQTCATGECTCPDGQDVCDNACTDMSSDEAHCGNCETTCGGSTQCLFGACLDPNSVTCSGGSKGADICGNGDSADLGKYWLNNNLWGMSSGSGSQCSWTTCQTGDLAGWSTSWNWSEGPSSVKSFASAVVGWQWGWKEATTGLPVQISSTKNVNCGWDFTVTLDGSVTNTINVAYDMWVHSLSNPGSNDTPTDEIMVWLYRVNGAGPIGIKKDTVSIGGADWDLYEGTTTWHVYSFVRTSNATTAVLNMMDFPRHLVTSTKVATKLTNSKYLTSVQAGTEVFVGKGQLDTKGFYCRVP